MRVSETDKMMIVYGRRVYSSKNCLKNSVRKKIESNSFFWVFIIFRMSSKLKF